MKRCNTSGNSISHVMSLKHIKLLLLKIKVLGGKNPQVANCFPSGACNVSFPVPQSKGTQWSCLLTSITSQQGQEESERAWGQARGPISLSPLHTGFLLWCRPDLQAVTLLFGLRICEWNSFIIFIIIIY